MDYLTASQAAELLKMSVSRVSLLIRDGRLPASKVGGIWLIKKDDLEAFARQPRPQGWPKGRPRKKGI